MLTTAFYSIALTTAAWAAWVRRGTCRIPFERSTTYAIIQMAVALVLIAPDTKPVTGGFFWELTGYWHVDDMLGHLLGLGALVSISVSGLLRMPSMHRYAVPLLWHPLVVGTAVLMMLFTRTTASRSPEHDMFRVHPVNHWVSTYLGVLIALMAYYGCLVGWMALVHLRGDPRAKEVAWAWLICVGIGFISAFGFSIVSLGVIGWHDYARLGSCAITVFYAVASARSWQRKLDGWRSLIEVTGARLL